MKTYTSTIQEDDSGNLVLLIPQEVLDQQGWQENTVLKFTNKSGTLYVEETRSPLEDPSIDDMLLAMLGSKKFVDQWWTTPNIGFGFEHPVDCDRKQVYTYILQHYIR